MRRPEGPHAVSFGKECKMAMMSKSSRKQGAAEGGAGVPSLARLQSWTADELWLGVRRGPKE